MKSSGYDRWVLSVAVILVATILVLPVIIIPTAYDPFRFTKVLVLRGSAILIMAVYALRMLWFPEKIDWRAVRHDRINQVCAFLVIWTVLSSWRSPEPAQSLHSATELTSGLVVFLAARHVGRFHAVALLKLVFIPGLINGSILVLQLLQVWHPLTSVEGYMLLPAEDRALLSRAALLGNRNDLGMFLLIPFAIAVGMWAGGKRQHIFALALAIIFLCTIMLTTTLTAIVIAWIIVIAEIVPLVVQRYGKRRATALAIALVAIGLATVGPLLDKTTEVHRKWQVNGLDVATGGRFGAFAVAASLAADHPFLGVGPGRYSVEYVDKATELRERWPDHFPSGKKLLFDMVHNDYLEILAEIGIVGLASALALVYLFWNAVKKSRQTKRDLMITSLARSLLTFILLAALLLFPLQVAAVYGSFAIVAGLTLGGLERSVDESGLH